MDNFATFLLFMNTFLLAYLAYVVSFALDRMAKPDSEEKRLNQYLQEGLKVSLAASYLALRATVFIGGAVMAIWGMFLIAEKYIIPLFQ